METNRLVQFCAIVETGNLRKAADILGISHSGLSKSMKAFEHELGIELFRHSGRGIVITDEGRELYNRSGPFLAELERLVGRTQDRPRDVIRIGSFEVFTSYFMGPFVRDFLADVELEVHELVPGRLEEALASNRVDIGITYQPIPRPGIEYLKIASVSMGAYALRGKFAQAKPEQIPFAVPVNPLEGTPSGVKGLDAWPERKIKRSVRYRVDLMATGLALARQGLCAIYIPRFVARLHNDETAPNHRLELLDLPKTINSVKREVYIIKRESMQENQIVKRIAKAVRLLASDPDRAREHDP